MRRERKFVLVSLLVGTFATQGMAPSHAGSDYPSVGRIERLEPAFARVSVWDQDGKQVDLGDVEIGPDDPKKLSVGVPPLSPGTYTVKCRVLSVDGHIVEEQFSFTLRGGQ